MAVGLSEAPLSSDLTLAEKIAWAVDFVIKDAVATWMSTRTEKASLSLVELADVISNLAASQVVQDDLSKDSEPSPKIKELMMTLNSLATIRQTSPVSLDQLQALISIREGKVSAAKPLQALIADPWWAERLRLVWATAAKESLAAPAMDEIRTTLKNSNAGDERAVAAAWSKAKDKLAAWRNTLRPGCTNSILTAMAVYLDKTLRSKATIPLAARDEEWLTMREIVRERATWLKQQCNIAASTTLPIEATIVSIVTGLEERSRGLLAETSAHMKFQQGLVLLTAFNEGNDSSLNPIVDVFRSCIGMQAAETATTAMLDAVAHLGKGAVTTAHAELATLLLSLMPADAGTEESGTVDNMRSQWELTYEGLQLADLFHSLGSAYNASVEQRAAVAAALEKWQPKWDKLVDPDGHVTDTSGLAASQTVLQPLIEAVTGLHEWQRAAYEQQVETAAKVASDAAEALKLLAGGTKDGASWKANLTGECTWEDIEREAAYHLTKEHSAQLDKRFAEAQKALQALLDVSAVAMTEPPQDIMEALDEALTEARVTGTERFFMEVFASGRADRRTSKVQTKVASMAKHKVPEDHIHPMIWEKAMAAAAC